MKTIERVVSLGLAVALVTACSGPSDDRSTESSAITGDNGLDLNGLSSNGLFSNGVWTNGVWTNGVWTNGVWTNGVWTNGVWTNGVWTNGVWTNGVWTNGVWTNGVWTNGIWDNGVWTNNLTAQEILRTNPYTRQVLQYLYECAMPAGVSTTLEPGDGTTIELAGKIGLGINADNTGWWESGLCDESCQRWTSACLLARTNAYGLKVQISMRAPADAPERIRAALAVTDEERAAFPLREGAFYGNLFQTTPPPEGTDGPVVNTPSFYACAGPGSNIPEITKRFCSSQGNNGPIDVVGTCEDACVGNDAPDGGGAMHGCNTQFDPLTTTRTGTEYSQVITIYVKDLIEVCGNAVCENNEAQSASCPSDCHPETWARSFAGTIVAKEGVYSAPSPEWYVPPIGCSDNDDTTPCTLEGVFATAPHTGPLGGSFWSRQSTVTTDDSIVLAGVLAEWGVPDVELGVPVESAPGAGGLSDAVTITLVAAKYGPNGDPVWAKRLQVLGAGGHSPGYQAGGLAVGTDNSIAISTTRVGRLGVVRANADGEPLWWLSAGGTGRQFATRAIAIDADGNTLIGGELTGDATVDVAAALSPYSVIASAFALPSATSVDAFILKVSPQGVPLWAKRFGDAGRDSTTSISVDTDGNIVATLFHDTSPAGLVKLSPDGDVLWSRRGNHWDAIADGAGNVYATGTLHPRLEESTSTRSPWQDEYDFACKYDPAIGAYRPSNPAFNFVCDARLTQARDFDLFVVKYDSNGNPIAATASTRSCDPTSACRGRIEGLDLKFAGGSVVVGAHGGLVSHPSDAVDFGVGPFHTYGTQDVFVATYSTDLALLWAKHIPMVLDGVNRGMDIDSRGRVVLSGTYAGSMVIDDRLLVNNNPLLENNGNTFLASFAMPPADDDAAPVITEAHVSQDLVLEATSEEGATAWYALPTSVDAGNAGTSVSCAPAPNSTFPIGTTTVECWARDPLGNTPPVPSTFTVTVADRAGPVFVSQPPTLIVAAADASGADVSFALPVAVDQVGGNRDVSCSPTSGSHFAIGTTLVTCSAADASGNRSEISFSVHVVSSSAPRLVVPQSVNATATSSAGAVVRYEAYAVDLEDGIVSTTCAPAPGSTFPLGTTIVTCSAIDQDGHASQATFAVTVSPAINWSGILQPINPDGSSTFKLKSTVPVKFKLTGASAGITSLVATLGLVKVSSTTSGTVVEATSTSAADTGNTFRYDATADQYVFNLSTKSLSVGTWELRIDLGDGVARSVRISLRN